eukprot:NODE_725_length_4426_cov_0.934597.p2 type:complete len:280 gc:universal NODE_725_length_4426_cov_0.934597:2837-3676(+)
MKDQIHSEKIESLLNIELLSSAAALKFNWNIEFAKRVVKEYFRFLELKIRFGNTGKNEFGCGWYIDKIWMMHAADIKEYQSDCYQICGYRVEYSDGNQQMLERSIEAYKITIGTPPYDIWRLSQSTYEALTQDSPTLSQWKPRLKICLERNTIVEKILPKKSQFLIIGIKPPTGKALYFKVHQYEKCYRLFRSYTEKTRLSLTDYKFCLCGKEIDSTERIRNLNLQAKGSCFQILPKNDKNDWQTPTPPLEPQLNTSNPICSTKLQYTIEEKTFPNFTD